MMILKNTPIYQMQDELGIMIHDTQYTNMLNWTSSSNPELTVKERCRRYISLIKLMIKLRYPRISAQTKLLNLHMNELIKVHKGKKL